MTDTSWNARFTGVVSMEEQRDGGAGVPDLLYARRGWARMAARQLLMSFHTLALVQASAGGRVLA